MAWKLLCTHWILLIGWGVLLCNAAAGGVYLELTLPIFGGPLCGWLFTTFMLIALLLIDASSWERLGAKYAFYPAALFAITQTLASIVFDLGAVRLLR